MAHEMLVGLEVIDDDGYRAYREAMAPRLAHYGGRFGYDFRVSEVLRSEVEAPINRVFTIRFPDASAMEAFFADAEYLAVKERLFTGSVASTTILATYDR